MTKISLNCSTYINLDFAEEVISEGLEEFPAYAACRLFRFRLPMLRETAYQSLTDNLRKEYHSKSVSFLRQDTNRCRSCGGGAFFSILGYRNQDASIFNFYSLLPLLLIHARPSVCQCFITPYIVL